MRAFVLACCACGSGGGARDAAPADGSRDPAVDARIDAAPQVFANLHATWHVTTVAGTAQPCPAAYPTGVLVARPTAGGPPIYNLFDCAAGTGTGTYQIGTYAFELDLANHIDADVAIASLPQTVVLTVPGMAAFTLLTDGGYYQVAWTLIGAVSGTHLACADVPGLAGIAISVSGPTATTQVFPCAPGLGMSTGLVAGTYGATVTAVDAANAPLGHAISPLAGQTIDVDNRVTSWGTVAIAIDGR